MRKLIIVGAGGYGRAVAEAAEATGEYEILGFADERFPALSTADGRAILGSTASLANLRRLSDLVVVAVGANKVREALAESAVLHGFRLASVVHPRAFVSPSAHIGAGTTVMAGSTVGSGCVLGEGAIVNYGCAIDHDCRVGRFAHLSVGASMGGGAVLEDNAWLQAGCTLGPGMMMGSPC